MWVMLKLTRLCDTRTETVIWTAVLIAALSMPILSRYMPALVLNYFGEGALLIENPAAISNPFYLMAPSWSLWPLIILATMASLIGSQAVISGVFSVTTHAVSRGLLQALVRHIDAALDRYSWQGVTQPTVDSGTIGSDARSLGGALLPIYANFAPDQDLFLKIAP